MSKPTGMPEWLRKKGIKAGEYQYITKPQLRKLQRPNRPLKVQVWATGMLHTIAYQGEEATTMRHNKRFPLTPGDIIKELHTIARAHYASAGIVGTDKQIAALKETKEDLRQAMQDLETDGDAMRTDANGTPLRELQPEQLRRLPSGRTRMFFWFIPRQPDPEEVVAEWEARQQQDPPPGDPEPDDLPSATEGEVGKISLPLPPISQILKGLKIDGEEGRQITARITEPAYQKNVDRAWRRAREIFLEVVNESLPEVAPDSPPEVGTTAGAFETKVETKVETRVAPSPRSPYISDLPSSSSSRANKDDDAGLVSQPKNKNIPTRKTLAELAPITDAVKKHGGHLSDSDLGRLFGACRDEAPDCTPEEVAHFCDATLTKAGKVTSVYRYLLKGVPRELQGEGLKRWRAKHSARKAEPSHAEIIAAHRANWASYNPTERESVLKQFPELGAEIGAGQ